MADEEVLRDDGGQEQENKNNSQEQEVTQSGLAELFNLDHDLLLLLLILLVFFSKRDIFSEQLQSLNQQANSIKNYLEAADATLQALDQASQMPKQILD